MPNKNATSHLIGVRRSQRGLNLLRECIAKHGWERARHGAKYKGFHLGQWVVLHRMHYWRGELAPWLVQELEAIPGWSWDPRSDRHRERLALLRRFVAQHGIQALSHSAVVDGVELGAWAGHQRRNYHKEKLADWLRRELDRIPGWCWETQGERQRKNLKLLKEFVSKRGVENLHYATQWRGVRIGAWATNRKTAYRMGQLPQWMADELEAIPGWTWAPRRLLGYHQQRLRLLRRFIAEHGMEALTQSTVVGGVPLGAWARYQLWSYRQRKIADWLTREFERIPGWSWDLRGDRQRKNLKLLKEFVSKRGIENLHHATQWRGVKLGAWATRCKTAYRAGRLDAQMTAQLEAIPGWKWSDRQQKHRKKLKLLQEFVGKHGIEGLRSTTQWRGVRIGAWATYCRYVYRRRRLSPWLVRELEAIPRWKWKSKRGRRSRSSVRKSTIGRRGAKSG